MDGGKRWGAGKQEQTVHGNEAGRVGACGNEDETMEEENSFGLTEKNKQKRRF